MNKYIRQVINGILPQTPKGTYFFNPIFQPLQKKFSYGNAQKDSILYTVFLLSQQKAVMIYCFNLFPENHFALIIKIPIDKYNIQVYV